MPWDRKRLLGYVEIIRFILGVTDKKVYPTPYPLAGVKGQIFKLVSFQYFWPKFYFRQRKNKYDTHHTY